MKNTNVTFLQVLVAGLLAGAAAEHFRLARAAGERQAVPTAAIRVPSPAQPDFTARAREEAAGEALRKRIADLERSLTLRQEQIAELQRAVQARDNQLAQLKDLSAPAAATTQAVARAGRPRRESFEDRMTRMRTENPEEFAALQNRRDEMRQRINNLVKDRKDFLTAVDVKAMSPEMRENHEKLLAAVAFSETMLARFGDGGQPNMTDEERRTMFETMRNVGGLYEKERRYLLEETGRALGEDGTAFADYVQNIYENTSLMPSFGPGRRGRNDRNRPGGAPPERGAAAAPGAAP
jgi:hypothetical protein